MDTATVSNAVAARRPEPCLIGNPLTTPTYHMSSQLTWYLTPHLRTGTFASDASAFVTGSPLVREAGCLFLVADGTTYI